MQEIRDEADEEEEEEVQRRKFYQSKTVLKETHIRTRTHARQARAHSRSVQSGSFQRPTQEQNL